jgi:hypothetical protein
MPTPLADIADKAYGLFLDFTGIAANDVYLGAGEVLNYAAIAAYVASIAEAETGRTIAIAMNENDANLYERGQNFTDITSFFADALSDALVGPDFVTITDEEE